MNRNRMIGSVVCAFCLFWDIAVSQEVITLSGSWTTNATGPASAGLDLTSQYTSSANIVTVNITRTGYNLFTNWSWHVTVQKSDVNWDDSLELSARRSSNGIGLGTIQNGTTYLVLEDSAQDFFNGTRHRYVVGLQYQLNGVSATIPAQTYTCDVIYTLYED